MPQEKKSPSPAAPEGRRDPTPFIILTVAVAVLLVLAAVILSPFVAPIVFAMVLATIGQPFFSWILRRIGERWRGPAAGLTCLALIVIVFAPLFWIGWSIAKEAPEGVRMVKGLIETSSQKLGGYAWFTDLKRKRWVQSLSASLESTLGTVEKALSEETAGAPPAGEGGKGPERPKQDPARPDQASPPPAPTDSPQAREQPLSMEKVVPVGFNIASWITQTATGILGNALEIFLQFCLMVFILYYFLKDGPQMLRSLKRAIPVDEGYQDKVAETFRLVSRSIIRGSIGTAIVQGAVAAVAFIVVGIPAVFWGVLTAFSSLIPPLGTALVMFPLTLYIFIFQGGHWWKGVFMAVVALVIGALDNVVRPLLVGQALHLHPIWLLLSVLGALAVFGPMGLIYGPMVLVLLGTVIALLSREERKEKLSSGK